MTENDYRYLGLDELSGLEHDMKLLVMEYCTEGWVGRFSAKGHVILRAPDDTKMTASVGRTARNGRSLANARRPLEQWRREREKRDKRPGDVFGLPVMGDAEGNEPPWRMVRQQSYEQRQQMRKMLAGSWEALGQRSAAGELIHLRTIESGPGDWTVLEVSDDTGITILGHGPDTAEDRRTEMQRIADLANIESGIMEAPVAKKQSQKEEGGYPCKEPGCKREFDSKESLRMHIRTGHSEEVACPLCGRKIGHRPALGRHLRSKQHEGDVRLPKALEMAGFQPTSTTHRSKDGFVRCEYCGYLLKPTSYGGHTMLHLNNGDPKKYRKESRPKDAKVIEVGQKGRKVLQAAQHAPAALEEVTPVAEPVQTVIAGSAVVDGSGEVQSSSQILAQVQALMNPQMVGDMERLRTRNHDLEARVEALTIEKDELQAWKDMMKEMLDQ